MEPRNLSSICQEIYRQFPEVKGVSPRITERPEGHLLIFKGSVRTSDGHNLPRTVRAVVDKNGKIIKLTTSK